MPIFDNCFVVQLAVLFHRECSSSLKVGLPELGSFCASWLSPELPARSRCHFSHRMYQEHQVGPWHLHVFPLICKSNEDFAVASPDASPPENQDMLHHKIRTCIKSFLGSFFAWGGGGCIVFLVILH